MVALDIVQVPLEEEKITRWQIIRAQFAEKGVLTLFLIPALLVLLFAQAYPLAYSGYISTVDWSLAKSSTPGPLVGLDNYKKAFSDTVFEDSVGTTVTFALTATAVELLLGFLLAYLTVGESFVLQVTRTILIMPMVVAPVAVGTLLADDPERALRAAQLLAIADRDRRTGLAG